MHFTCINGVTNLKCLGWPPYHRDKEKPSPFCAARTRKQPSCRKEREGYEQSLDDVTTGTVYHTNTHTVHICTVCMYILYMHKLRQTDIRIHDIHTCMQPTDTHHYHLHYIVVLPCCQGNWIKAGTTYDVRLQPPPHFTWCCPPLVFRSEHHNYLAQTFILTSRMYMHMYLRTYTYVCMYAHTHVCILCILCMYVCMYIDR